MKRLQSVMRIDIGSHLSATILSLSLMVSAGNLSSGTKGLSVIGYRLAINFS